jgi:CRP-like cAMP-binding protein
MARGAPLLNTRNRILTVLDDRELEMIDSKIEPMEFPHGKMLYQHDDPIETVYFPHDGMHSVITVTDDGRGIEAGLIGFEGMTGVTALMGSERSFNAYMVQMEGSGHRMNADDAKQLFDLGGPFRTAVLAFVRGFMSQVSQTALCNRVHSAEQRLAKWLLSCNDRVPGDVLSITQEFLATMLGSNRTSVTIAAGELQRSGCIEYSRGKITILNRVGLKAASCECYQKIRRQYEAFS